VLEPRRAQAGEVGPAVREAHEPPGRLGQLEPRQPAAAHVDPDEVGAQRLHGGQRAVGEGHVAQRHAREARAAEVDALERALDELDRVGVGAREVEVGEGLADVVGVIPDHAGGS